MATATAKERAEKTISELINSEVPPEESHQQEAYQDQQPPERKLKPNSRSIDTGQPSRKKDPSEDFFDYLAKITTDEWSGGACSLYIYKEAARGNVRVERMYRPISYDEFKDEIVTRHGPGNYLLQFTTRLKHLSSCSQRLTAEGGNISVLGDAASGGLGTPGFNTPLLTGVNESLKLIADSSKESNKANIEIVRDLIKENNKPLDIAGMITAITSIIPKQDNTFLVTLLENQRQEAEKRAERERIEARERQERSDKEAKERQDRDAQFYQLLNNQTKSMFEIILKEKEKKEDTFGVLDVLKGMFAAFAEERLNGEGAPGAGGWAGVLERVLPKVFETAQTYAPLIYQKMNPQAGPGQVPVVPPQIPASVNPQPINGGAQQPGIPSLMSREQQFADFINRLGLYLSTRDASIWETAYVISVMDVEYPEILTLFEQQSNDIIVNTVRSFPIGANILTNEQGGKFISALIEDIKNPPPDDESIEGPEQPAEEGKKRGRPRKVQQVQ